MHFLAHCDGIHVYTCVYSVWFMSTLVAVSIVLPAQPSTGHVDSNTGLLYIYRMSSTDS